MAMTEAVQSTPAPATRTGRALLGWMGKPEAQLVMSGQRTDAVVSDETTARIDAAHAAVGARPAGFSQEVLIEDLPDDLDGYVDELRAGAGQTFFDEGWAIGVADLNRVCAIQPVVFEDGFTRCSGAREGDLLGLARITLPATATEQFQVNADAGRPVVVVWSTNPNLRVLGQFATPALTGQQPAVGFNVGVMPSMVQVVRVRDRYVLRDGYHRAVGLVRAGITRAPVFVWDNTVREQPLPTGMLPADAYLGPRPPVLRDYLDDSVAQTVELPFARKGIMVQATEFLIGS